VWSAGLGLGATCDGKRLSVSGATDVALSLLSTGFSYRAERRARQVAMIAGLLPHVRDVRRTGSAALDLCAVAAALVATEAGAVVRTPGVGGRMPPEDGLGADALYAATPAIADELRRLVVDN